MIEKNFEIDEKFYRKLKGYADFIDISMKCLMKVLLIYGIHEYMQDKKKIEIKRVDSIRKLKKDICAKEKAYIQEIDNIERAESKQEKATAQEKEDILFTAMEKSKKTAKYRIKKCKIDIPDVEASKLDYILSEQKSLGGKCTQNDIIYSLLRYAMYEELDYLSNMCEWQGDLINDEEYNKPRDIRLQIPQIIYRKLENEAKTFGITTNEYLKIRFCDYLGNYRE